MLLMKFLLRLPTNNSIFWHHCHLLYLGVYYSCLFWMMIPLQFVIYFPTICFCFLFNSSSSPCYSYVVGILQRRWLLWISKTYPLCHWYSSLKLILLKFLIWFPTTISLFAINYTHCVGLFHLQGHTLTILYLILICKGSLMLLIFLIKVSVGGVSGFLFVVNITTPG